MASANDTQFDGETEADIATIRRIIDKNFAEFSVAKKNLLVGRSLARLYKPNWYEVPKARHTPELVASDVCDDERRAQEEHARKLRVSGRLPVCDETHLGTPSENASAALGIAQLVAMQSEDPCRQAALATIETALRAILGERDGLDTDSLLRLRETIRHGGTDKNRDADFREIVRLIMQTMERVESHREKAESDRLDIATRRIVAKEAPLLCRDLHGRFSVPFGCLTAEDCGKALLGLFRSHGHGAHRVTGVAADIIIASGAWDWTEDRRQALQTAISRAVSRGKT